MTSKRIYFAMIGINALLIVVTGVVLVFADHMLKKQSDIIVAKKRESAVL